MLGPCFSDFYNEHYYAKYMTMTSSLLDLKFCLDAVFLLLWSLARSCSGLLCFLLLFIVLSVVLKAIVVVGLPLIVFSFIC